MAGPARHEEERLTEPTRLAVPRRRLPLAAWRWGDPGGEPLVLVHGGRDHARSWDRVAAAFPDRQAIAPDLRGHGDSGWAEDGAYAIADHVGDLLHLLDTLDLARIDLVGHSLGGNVAWRLAALFPERVRTLCVIEGLGPAPAKVAAAEARPLAARLREEIAPTGHGARRARVYPDVAAAAARLRQANPRLKEALTLHLARHGTKPVEGGVVFKHDPALTGMQSIDLCNADRRALWSAIEAPTLLVHGADSWASNPAEDGRLEAFRDARSVSLPDAGHWVHHDRPDEFTALLRGFLEQVATDQPPSARRLSR